MLTLGTAMICHLRSRTARSGICPRRTWTSSATRTASCRCGSLVLFGSSAHKLTTDLWLLAVPTRGPRSSGPSSPPSAPAESHKFTQLANWLVVRCVKFSCAGLWLACSLVHSPWLLVDLASCFETLVQSTLTSLAEVRRGRGGVACATSASLSSELSTGTPNLG